MHPKIGLRGGNARWLPIAAILNGNISGPLPLKSLAFSILSFLAVFAPPQGWEDGSADPITGLAVG
jgi:hypothetical protein